MTKAEYHDRLREQARKQYGKRDLAILARRADGWTLDRIAAKYGITKERARQIVVRAERLASEGA